MDDESLLSYDASGEAYVSGEEEDDVPVCPDADTSTATDDYFDNVSAQSFQSDIPVPSYASESSFIFNGPSLESNIRSTNGTDEVSGLLDEAALASILGSIIRR